MRHRKDGRQFGRNTSHRRAMFRNLAGNLLTHERIVTTEAKAKELRRVAAKLITKAKRIGEAAYTPQDKLDDVQKAKRLHVAHQLAAFLPRYGVTRDGQPTDLVEKVLIELSQRFKERSGGYTRIIKLGPRAGDGAKMTIIELIDAPPIGDDDDLDEAVAAADGDDVEDDADAAEEGDGEEASAEESSEEEEEEED